jgi:hypothetical protein
MLVERFFMNDEERKRRYEEMVEDMHRFNLLYYVVFLAP